MPKLTRWQKFHISKKRGYPYVDGNIPYVSRAYTYARAVTNVLSDELTTKWSAATATKKKTKWSASDV